VVSVTTYAPDRHLRLPHANTWLVALVAVVVLALAVGAGVLIGRSTKGAPSVPGLASEEMVAAVEGSMVAFENRDFDAFGAYFATDAVFEEPDLNRTFEGRQEIVDLHRSIVKLGGEAACYERGDSVAIQTGNRVAFVSRTCDGKDTFIDVVRFNDEGKISHWWDIGTGFTPWTGQQP
jgi:hypothetical protein